MSISSDFLFFFNFRRFRPFAAPSKYRPVRPAPPAPSSLRHWSARRRRRQNDVGLGH